MGFDLIFCPLHNLLDWIQNSVNQRARQLQTFGFIPQDGTRGQNLGYLEILFYIVFEQQVQFWADFLWFPTLVLIPQGVTSYQNLECC